MSFVLRRAGENLTSVDGIKLIPAPALSVLLDQQLIEKESQSLDGEKKKTSYLEQQLFGVGCSSTPDALTLYPLDMSVVLDNPVAGTFLRSFFVERYCSSNADKQLLLCEAPRRVSASLAKLQPTDEVRVSEPVAKRQKVEENGGTSTPKLQELSAEVERFATLLSGVLD
jgi:hypothetical protein